MLTLREDKFLDQMRNFISASEISHLCQNEVPAYQAANPNLCQLQLEFQPFGPALTAPSLVIRVDPKVQHPAHPIVEEREDGTQVRFFTYKFDAQSIRIQSGNYVEKPMTAALINEIESSVINIARQIKHAVVSYDYIYDVYVRTPPPPEPTILDELAARSEDAVDETLSGLKKSRLEDICREVDLAVSGNIPDLIERIRSASEDRGDREVLENWNEWEDGGKHELYEGTIRLGKHLSQ